MKLLGKLLINGKIETLTGISIGGSSSDVMIGGIDNPVIKNPKGIPYIPGSSIKGKLRYLLEISEGENICSCGKCDICKIFGVGANNKKDNTGPTRIKVRDSYMSEDIVEKMERKEGVFENLELLYTEGKWENTIDRLNSRANPRQMERVPAGVTFELNMIYDVLNVEDIERFNVFLASMRMLEDDYLGGSGSRGYGKVKFIDLDLRVKSIDDYKEAREGERLNIDLLKDENIEEEIKRALGV